MTTWLALLLAYLPFQVGESLTVGEAILGEIADGDPVVHTETLDKGFTKAPTVGRSFVLEVGEPGLYSLELRSYFFDAYLVLRDAEGNVLAEDDDGLIDVHARLVAELRSGTYHVEVCALHGARGGFELALRFGETATEELTPLERAAAEREDLQHRVRVLEQSLDSDDPHVATSLNKLAYRLRSQGDYTDALLFYERALAIREEVLGPEHPKVAESLNNLATLLLSQGDYPGARPLYERALAIKERVLGSEHPDTATSLGNLATLLVNQGDHTGARPLYERALAIREKTLGPEHPEVARILSNLAVLLARQGDYTGARPLHERALAIRREALGPEHPDVAQSLNNMAVLLLSQGDYTDARPLFERALAIEEEVLGPEHPRVAGSLNNLAKLLLAQGDYTGARPLYERALAIYEKVVGPEHPTTATILNNLAGLLEDQGDYAGARQLYERTLAMREKSLGPEHPSTATSLGNLAGLLRSQGDYAGARPLYERALAITEKALGPEHPAVATSLNNLAALLLSQGDHAGARPLFERSLAIREKALGSEHPAVATSLANLASLYDYQANYAGAQPLHERALVIRDKVLGPEHPDTARSLNSLAQLFRSKGDPAGARPLYERALRIREKALGPEHPLTATSLNNLAALLAFQGDFSGARPLLERALAICEEVLGPEHPDTTKVLNGLAGVLRSQGDHAGARPLYERIHVIREKALGPDHPDTALSLNNLAALLWSQGDYAGARPLLERALEISEKALGPEHPQVATILSNLAGLLTDQGDYAGARPLCERALAIREEAQGPEHPDTVKILNILAMLLFDSGEGQAALQLLSRAARGRSGYLNRLLQGLSEAESYRYLAKLRWQLEMQLSIASALERPGGAAESYRWLSEWKGRIARTMVASRGQLARELDDEQSRLVEELRGAQARLSRLLSEEPPGLEEARAARADQVGELRELRNALELELKRSLEASDHEPVPTARELAGALPPRSAVADLFVYRLYEPAHHEQGELVRASLRSDRVSAWIVRAGDPEVVRVDLGPAAAMQAGVRDHLRRLVSDGVARGTRLTAETDKARDPAVSLLDLLWAPLSEHLKGVDTVFVSPDSFLGGLPMETIEGEDGRYLVEDVAFVYQQDVSSLARVSSRSTGAMDSLLSVGGIDFGRRAEWREAVASAASGRSNAALRGSHSDRWSLLPGTDAESHAVHALHEEARGDESGRVLLQGGDPTEERLKHELPRHAVLHLATHGFFHPEGTPSMWESALNEAGQQEMRMSTEASHLVGQHPGLLSGLVCAGANLPPEAEGDDGYLTAEEVGWLDLSGVELVVMSACETGLGRAESGEGLIGLRRAFRTAGAKTVVSSLWSVGDESTAELMRDFYINLWMKGMGRLEALRAAQLAMLRKNRMEHGGALPSTWGAFVLSGEWR